ncbi:MAG: O-antigen ligase family protein [bacterium]
MFPDALPLVLIAAPVATFVAIRWRRALLLSLPFLVTLNGVPLSGGGVSLRLDQLVACLLMIPLLAGAVAGTRRVRLDAASVCLMALLATNVLSSVLNSPVPAYSIRQCVNLASTWVIYVLMLNFLESASELEEFLACVVWAAIAASATGVIAFVLAVSGASIGGAEVSTSAAENLTHAYGAYGTMIEPNIFGSFTAANLLLCGAMLVGRSGESSPRISRTLLRWAVVFTGIGLVLSFTRGAWLGTVVGAACLIFAGRRTIRLRFRAGPLLASLVVTGVLLGILLVLPGETGTFFRFKLANIVNPASQTALVRWFSSIVALDQAAQHPFIGWGTFSFAALTAQGVDFQQFENWRNLWIGNYLLLALHDTGVIGLVFLVGVVVTVLTSASRAIRAMARAQNEYASRVLGLTAAFASFLVAFLATTGLSLGYSWLFMGLLACYARLVNERKLIVE